MAFPLQKMSHLICSAKCVERQDREYTVTDMDCVTPIWLGGEVGSTVARFNLDLTPMWLDSDEEDQAAEAPTQELPTYLGTRTLAVTHRELSLHLTDNSLYCRRTGSGLQ